MLQPDRLRLLVGERALEFLQRPEPVTHFCAFGPATAYGSTGSKFSDSTIPRKLSPRGDGVFWHLA